MTLQISSILLATFIQFILGALWYSPLMFGRWWMEIMECSHLSKEELKKMQKGMGPFYGLQLLLTLVTTLIFAILLNGLPKEWSVYGLAFFFWIGFVVPTQIAGVIWANTKKKFWSKQLFVMTSYQFVALMITAYLLS